MLRKILYAFGPRDPEDLNRLSARFSMDKYIAIHIGDLFEAVREGIDSFLRESALDAAKVALINKKAVLVFGRVTDLSVDALTALQTGGVRTGER